MTIASSQISITTSATLIAKSDTGGKVTTIRHRGSNPIFLGGSTVTTGTGFQLNAGESLSLDLSAGDALYGIVAAGTESLHLVTGSSAT